MEDKKEPTWKEALKISREWTKKKLAPMKQAMLEAVKKSSWEKSFIAATNEVNKKLSLVKQVIFDISKEKGGN